MTLTVTMGASALALLHTQARQACPEESCALLLGVQEGERHFIVQNIELSANCTDGDPRTRFELDPTLHIRAQRAARRGGPAVLGVWHSHPAGQAWPSAADRLASVEKNWLWLISGRGQTEDVGVGEKRWETKAFVTGCDDPADFQPATLIIER